MVAHRRNFALVIAALSVAYSGSASARGCVPDRAALPETVLQGYRANPDELLKDSGQSIGMASSRIRNAVATDAEMLASLQPSLKAATGSDAQSIGIGLGAAAQICARSLPSVSQSIQRAVEESGNPVLQRAFADVIGDQAVLSTAATSAGGIALGSATLGGGPHRPTETPTYGFATPPSVTSSGTLLPISSSAASSGSTSSGLQAAPVLRPAEFVSAFQSVSGFR